jgi:hypothetical protein
MAHFNYYKQGNSAAADRCFKIVKPSTGEVYDSDGNVLSTSIATLAHQFTDITYSDLLHGYPITLPALLPNGEYDILFFNAAAAAMTATTEPEAGYGITWNTDFGLIAPPMEKLTDRIY